MTGTTKRSELSDALADVEVQRDALAEALLEMRNFLVLGGDWPGLGRADAALRGAGVVEGRRLP